MRCDNCGAAVPRDAGACPECGVFVRVLPQKRRARSYVWVIGLLLIAAGVAAATYFGTRAPKPIAIVMAPKVDRGGPVSQPEAMRRLQRALNKKPDCVAIISHGLRHGAWEMSAVNRCDSTKLGRWRVDAKSGSVSKHND